MSDRFLDHRRASLEGAFFARHHEELRRRLAEAGEQAHRRHALAAASHIQDPAVLDRLLALGVSAGTLSALTLAPLVLVAWADGVLSDMERKAVLDAAAREGILRDTPGYKLLEDWLGQKPGPQLMATWKDYVRELTTPLDLDARRELERHVMDKAHQVADAAGGFLGLSSRVSAAEREMLSDLGSAFHP